MIKISKLKLLLAIVITNSPTLYAKPLEEAIKNVEVSGSAVYRYENMSDKYGDSSTQKNKYKIALNLSSKINDDVKFNSRFIAGNLGDNDFGTLESHNGSDENMNLFLANANFAYTSIKNTTIIVGKQGLYTPYTIASDINGNEHTGTGIFSVTGWANITAGIGYFNQTNLNQSTDMSPSTIFGKKGLNKPILDILNDSADGHNLGSRDMYIATLQADLNQVNLEAWYMNVENTLDTYTLVANIKVKPSDNSKIGVEARYVNLTLQNPDPILDSKNNAMGKLMLTGSVGIVNMSASYLQTSKDGGLTTFDADSQNTTAGWNLTSIGIPNAKHWDTRFGVNIVDNLELAFYYGHVTSNGGSYDSIENFRGEEYFTQITYEISKNMTAYARFGNYNEKLNDEKTRDQNMTRLQIGYTF